MSSTAPYPKNILMTSETFWASAWYRAHVPGVALSNLGHNVILTRKPTPTEVLQCDVFATRFWVNPEMWQAMQHAKSLGKLCVVDIDDDIWTLHPDNPGHAHYSRPEIAAFAREVVRMADVVTAATPYLADLVRPMNKNVHVIENTLPSEYWPAAPKNIAHEPPIVVGWSGSSSHLPDLKILAGVIESIIDQYPHVHVLYSDSVGEAPFGKHERIRGLPSVRQEDYAGLLLNFDIGLAPILDTRFNRSKSDLKIIEYGMCGIPTIASKVLPYEHSVKPGVNGFLAQAPKDWIKYLRQLIEDEDLRTRMGAGARAFAEARTIDKHLDKWVRVMKLDEPAAS